MEWETTAVVSQGHESVGVDGCGDDVGRNVARVHAGLKSNKNMDNTAEWEMSLSGGSRDRNCPKLDDSKDDFKDIDDFKDNNNDNRKRLLLMSPASGIIAKIMRNTGTVLEDFELSYTPTSVGEHKSLDESGKALRTFHQSQVTEPSDLNPRGFLVMRSEKDLTREDHVLSSQIFDSDVSNQTESSQRASILHAFESTDKVLSVNPFRESIIRTSGDKRVQVANLACVDSNFNVAFISDIVGQSVYTTTLSNSGKFNGSLSFANIQPNLRPDSGQIGAGTSTKKAALKISTILDYAEGKSADKVISPNGNKQQGLALTICSCEGHCPLTDSASITQNPSTSCSIFGSLGTHTALMSNPLPSVVFTRLQPVTTSTEIGPRIFEETMEVDSDERTSANEHTPNDVISDAPTRDFIITNVRHHDDINIADDAKSLSKFTPNSVLFAEFPSTDSKTNKPNLLITNGNKRIRCTVSADVSRNVKNVSTSFLATSLSAVNSCYIVTPTSAGIDDIISGIVPSNNIHQPTHSINQTANSMNQPVNSINQPVNYINQSANSINQIFNSINQPVDSVNQTANSISQTLNSINETINFVHQNINVNKQSNKSTNQTASFTQMTVNSTTFPSNSSHYLTNSTHNTTNNAQQINYSTNHVTISPNLNSKYTNQTTSSAHFPCNSTHLASNSTNQTPNSAHLPPNSANKTTHSPNQTTISTHLTSSSTNQTTNSAHLTCNSSHLPSNSINQTTNSAPLSSNSNQQPIKFSVPFSKPVFTKAPLRFSNSPKLRISSSASKLPNRQTQNSTATNLPQSVSNNGGQTLPKMNSPTQITETLSIVSNGQSATPRNSKTNLTFKTGGNKSDIPSSKFSKGELRLQNTTELRKSPREVTIGGAFLLNYASHTEVTFNELGSCQNGVPEEDKKMDTTTSSLALGYGYTATATLAKLSAVNNLNAVTFSGKSDSSPQKTAQVETPEKQTICLLPTPDICIIGGPIESSDISTVSLEAGITHISSASSFSLEASSTAAFSTAETRPSTTTTTTTDSRGGEMGRRLRNRNQRRFLPEKTRHKRQTLQDMTRPLKQWLYKHRANPYPSKHEKIELVGTSHMSLTQVSNWFANARRRLKNTVSGDGLTWAKRITEYNHCAEGNVELFSIPSEEEEAWDSDDEANERQEPRIHEPLNCQSRNPSPALTITSSFSDPLLSPQITTSSSMTSQSAPTRCSPALDEQHNNYHKYKHSILQRYLQDASQQTLLPVDDLLACRARHRHLSSSTGSHDFEYLSTSSVSSPSHETPHDSFDEFSEEFETIAIRRRVTENPGDHQNDEMYWKEIGAALALTSLAQSHVSK